MENTLYSYSPFCDRPPLEFPEGKKLAFYIGLNIEHFRIDLPNMANNRIPDPISLGWRDYGTRVGIWRLMDLFDDVGIRVSAITNSEVCTQYPKIIEAGVEREWAWIAHGKTNSIMQSGMGADEERVFLEEMMAEFNASLPSPPKGWLGPGLTETFETPTILRDLGIEYLLDWCCDDQPFSFSIPGLVSVPYSIDVNDISMFLGGTHTGAQYETIVMDQFEGLLADAQKTGIVMGLPLHTFIVGQPYRHKYLSRILHAICSHEDVWVTTSEDIARHYRESVGRSEAAA